jgi:hypothetical protein
MIRKDLLILAILCLASAALCRQSLKPLGKSLGHKARAVQRAHDLQENEQNLGETEECRVLRQQTDSCTDALNLAVNDQVALLQLGYCEVGYISWVQQCQGSDQKPKLLGKPQSRPK